ncbi:cyclopropane-fatty-acyl-phospholipid synthase family protein [Chroococcus sp. FPU101]|uniref:SAM-dependent methyltransferase n=1 Tax=Chroococcus sp. FPU101 TaxID=1974212 RepID=UPI001A8C6D7A|nr:class I SAM-dependent methyltransferase [Chroococcus sp. FPU101]GFE68173.1 hypothetical protein CFPU101_07830 [Chroococcus sp. FPU101]
MVKQLLFTSSDEKRHSLVGSSQLWQMKRNFQIQFLKSVGLQPENYLLDIGCGTLRGGIPLIKYLQKDHYFGIEARENALLEGRKEIKKFNLEEKNPTLICTKDVSSLTLEQKFDFIWAFSVLFHMSDEILDSYLSLISKSLKNDGAFYANVMIYNSLDEKSKQTGNWKEFPVMNRTLDFYQELGLHHNLGFAELGTLADLGHLSNTGQDQQKMLKFWKI